MVLEAMGLAQKVGVSGFSRYTALLSAAGMGQGAGWETLSLPIRISILAVPVALATLLLVFIFKKRRSDRFEGTALEVEGTVTKVTGIMIRSSITTRTHIEYQVKDTKYKKVFREAGYYFGFGELPEYTFQEGEKVILCYDPKCPQYALPRWYSPRKYTSAIVWVAILLALYLGMLLLELLG